MTSIKTGAPHFTKPTVGAAYRVRGTDEVRSPTEHDVVHNNEIVGSHPDEEERARILKRAQQKE